MGSEAGSLLSPGAAEPVSPTLLTYNPYPRICGIPEGQAEDPDFSGVTVSRAGTRTRTSSASQS